MPYTIEPGREIDGGRISEGVRFDLTKGPPTEQELQEASKIIARGMESLGATKKESFLSKVDRLTDSQREKLSHDLAQWPDQKEPCRIAFNKDGAEVLPADGKAVLEGLSSCAKAVAKGQKGITYKEAAHVTEDMRNLWESCGKLIYRLPLNQLPFLRAIDLHDVTTHDIQLPAQCIRFERGADFATLCKYQDVIVLRATTAGITSLATLPISSVPLDTLLARSIANGNDQTGGAISEADHLATLQDWWACIVNTLFLKEAKPEYFDFIPLAKDRAVYDEAKRKGLQGSQNIIEARATRKRGPIWELHSPAVWLADLGEAGESVGTYHPLTRRGEVSRAYVVRGHWRRQRHGKGNALVKLLLIPPQVRRADLMPGRAATKENGSLAL